MVQAVEKKAPSLLKLCIQTAIDNIRYMEDVGETDIHLLKEILPHCTADQLMHIERSSQGRDLTSVTDSLWKKFYQQHFGEESLNLVLKRMKQKQVVFKWRQLYEAKLKERDEAQQRSVERLRKLYAEEGVKKESRKIQICSKVPPSNKRSFWGGSGPGGSCSGKGNLMKKARTEFLKSHEVKAHQAMRRTAFQTKPLPSSSVSRPIKPSGSQPAGLSRQPVRR
ncbi:elongin-A-like [Aristolochia californica]|uniref:elongin-A-like n=1 Tax=Aristolochia californica TaxID=171875 RepID=UPI0035DDC280